MSRIRKRGARKKELYSLHRFYATVSSPENSFMLWIASRRVKRSEVTLRNYSQINACYSDSQANT